MAVHETNIAILFFILAVFLTSLVFKWKKRYFIHGTLMLVAAISYLPPFLLFMNFIASKYTVTEVMDALFANSLTLSMFAIHTLLGVLSGLLAIWILGSWRLRPTQFCTKNKKKMRYTAILWISSHILGILLYALLNTNLLMGMQIQHRIKKMGYKRNCRCNLNSHNRRNRLLTVLDSNLFFRFSETQLTIEPLR